MYQLYGSLTRNRIKKALYNETRDLRLSTEKNVMIKWQSRFFLMKFYRSSSPQRSTAGNRPPPRVATTIGPTLHTSPRISIGRCSTSCEAYPRYVFISNLILPKIKTHSKTLSHIIDIALGNGAVKQMSPNELHLINTNPKTGFRSRFESSFANNFVIIGSAWRSTFFCESYLG